MESSTWGTTRNQKENKEPSEPGVFHTWSRYPGSGVKNGLENCHDT